MEQPAMSKSSSSCSKVVVVVVGWEEVAWANKRMAMPPVGNRPGGYVRPPDTWPFWLLEVNTAFLQLKCDKGLLFLEPCDDAKAQKLKKTDLAFSSTHKSSNWVQGTTLKLRGRVIFRKKNNLQGTRIYHFCRSSHKPLGSIRHLGTSVIVYSVYMLSLFWPQI